MGRRQSPAAAAAAGLPALLLCMLCSCTAGSDDDGRRPLIIAHRGSPCELPEETLEGYAAALDVGVDFIELDAVSTKDGHLICRHGPTLGDSTNIASHEDLARRNSTQILPDGRTVSGYFTADFTLDEVRRLRATQAFPFRDHSHDGKFRIPALADVLGLVKGRIDSGQTAGVYLEAKEPSYHDQRGLPLERGIVQELLQGGFQHLMARHVVLQSFEEQSLAKLAAELQDSGVKRHEMPALTWLFDCGGEPSAAQLDAFAVYGQGLGPSKQILEAVTPAPSRCGQPPDATMCGPPGRNCSGSLGASFTHWDSPGGSPPESALLEAAAARGLYVHPWTVRREGQFQPADFGGDVTSELDFLAGPLGLGVQGLFLDCPHVAAAWLASHGWDLTQRPRTQAANGIMGSALGQPAGDSKLSHAEDEAPDSRDGRGGFEGARPWLEVVAAAAVLLAVAAATAAGVALWLRCRRHGSNRYDVFPDIMLPTDYSEYGRERLSATGVPPSPMLRGDLQLTALPPESPFALAHSWDPGGEQESLVHGFKL